MAAVTATVTGASSPTYKVYTWTGSALGTLLATGSSLPLTFTPLSGTNQYVLVTESHAGACVDVSSPSSFSCNLGLISFDFVYGLGTDGSGGDAECNNNIFTNNFQFRLIDEDNTSSEFNQQANIGSGTDKTIPNSSAITAAYVVAAVTKSCGGNYPTCNPPLQPCSIGFNRFGIDYGALITAYPSKNVFSYAVYARKDPAKNITSDNNYDVRINKFTDCDFVAVATANGVDFSRTGTCGELGIVYYPSFGGQYTLTGAPTTFTKVGNLTYTKSTDTIIFQPV